MESLLTLSSVEAKIFLSLVAGICYSIAIPYLWIRFFSVRPILTMSISNKKRMFKLLILLINTFIAMWCYGFLFLSLTGKPKVVLTNPKQNQELTSYEEPIVLEFDRPVRMKSLILNTSSETFATWEREMYASWLPLGRKIMFKPQISFETEEKIMMYLANIQSTLQLDHGSEYLFEFFPPKKSSIRQANITNGDTTVSPTQTITFQLTNNNTPQSAWEFIVNPEHVFKTVYTQKAIELIPQDPLRQGTTYTITAYQRPTRYDIQTKKIFSQEKSKNIYELSFSTTKAPFIQSFLPNGTTVKPNESIIITFDQPMQKDSVVTNISISPEITPSFFWSNDNKVLSIQSTGLQKNTTYTVIFNPGITSLTNGILQEQLSYRFTTAGPVFITQSSPEHNSTSFFVDSAITVTFNQEVDKQSAEKNFLLTPLVRGTVVWEGNTLKFSPEQSLNYQTKYTLNLKKGIKSIYGLDSIQDHTVIFSTVPQEFSIEVPYYKQEEMFTCNLAATRMILAYRSIQKTEKEIKDAVGTSGSRGNGNPQSGFVVEYGTYWEPIQKLAQTYRETKLFKNWNLADLITEVSRGNPVLIWGQNGWSSPHDISWKLPGGETLYAINGMHSYVVRGFRGTAANPTHILVHDPWRGTYAMTVDEFIRRWKFFLTALVVY